MRKPRIKGVGLSVYHCVSRIVGREFLFQEEEKDRFVAIMRDLEAFHGVRILCYCVMSNHFHILVEVPDRESVARLDEETILGRVRALYGRAAEEDLRERLEQAGETAFKEALLGRYRERMVEISRFVKELKQRFSIWYNRKRDRVGTLWEERFKSLLVEGDEKAVLAVAAYIDLNPLRAGLVKKPEDYRWCSYGASVAGAEAARSGLGRLFKFSRRLCGEELESNWKKAGALYRRWLEERCAGALPRDGETPPPGGRGRTGPGNGEERAVAWALMAEVGYLLTSAALGSAPFVNALFERHRDQFGEGRSTGALPLEGMEGEELKGLCVLQRPRRHPSGVRRFFPAQERHLKQHPKGR